MTHRIERVDNLIRREISGLLQRRVKDPRLGSFVIVTEVATSPDLRHAKVLITRMGSKQEREESLSALASASGFLRSELAKHLKLRRIPQLNFQLDDSIERGARLLELIDRVGSGQDAEGL
jgi:ribosome-binding factor A